MKNRQHGGAGKLPGGVEGRLARSLKTTKDDIKNSKLSKAIDFVRDPVSDKKLFVYHHIGIYGFTKNALNKYINLKRSNLELSRNLEQMRALENNMKIDVLYTDSDPLSVDTEADLEEIKNLMEK